MTCRRDAARGASDARGRAAWDSEGKQRERGGGGRAVRVGQRTRRGRDALGASDASGLATPKLAGRG